jgi:hypothetical protein
MPHLDTNVLLSVVLSRRSADEVSEVGSLCYKRQRMTPEMEE